jgi:hypothetical protein
MCPLGPSNRVARRSRTGLNAASRPRVESRHWAATHSSSCPEPHTQCTGWSRFFWAIGRLGRRAPASIPTMATRASATVVVVPTRRLVCLPVEYDGNSDLGRRRPPGLQDEIGGPRRPFRPEPATAAPHLSSGSAPTCNGSSAGSKARRASWRSPSTARPRAAICHREGTASGMHGREMPAASTGT